MNASRNSTETVAHLNQPYKIITLDIARKGARQHVIKTVEEGLASGLNTFKIRIARPNSPAYPSMCVPIAGTFDYYRHEKNCVFISTGSMKSSPYLYKTHFLDPRSFDTSQAKAVDFLNCVWRFTPIDEFEIVSGIVRSIRSKRELEPGVIESIELCLHEIMDNVLNHSLPDEDQSEIPLGYVMAQCHQESETVAFAVFDNGQGIPKSFERSKYQPKTAEEAIRLALSKNVTSGKGAGRGMWMLSSIVKSSRGMIEISSDRARYLLTHNEDNEDAEPVFSKIGAEINGTTSVDFRLRTNRQINIAQALDGHEPVDLWLQNHEIDEDTIVFNIEKESRGTGTRYAARELRNIVINASRQRGQRVILDFRDTSIVSSSYTDELIGKLIDEIGFVRFIDRFRLRNLSETNALIIDEALLSHFRASDIASV